MNKTHGLQSIAALLSVAAAAAFTLPAHATGNLLTPLDKKFVTKVAQGNLAEIKTSQIALTHTTNKDVLMVAHRLIKDHSTAQADLRQRGEKLHVAVPTQTDAMHMALYRKLSGLHGSAFDHAFMKAQVGDHDKTVALFKTELQNGQESHVRGFAAKYLPTIQDHTIMIHNVAANIGADPSVPKSMRKQEHSMKMGHKMGRM